MKKILLLLLIIVTLVACGGEKQDTAKGENTPQTTVNTLKVEVITVTPQTFEHYFTANGAVEAVNDAFISPETNGQVKKVHVKEGQRVCKGQLLVSLNSDIITSTIAETKSSLELARTIYEKRKGLWDKKIGSEVQYLQAKNSKETLESRLKSLKAQLDMVKITAPISGIVDKVYLKEGELAAPGMQLIQLVNLKKVYINADVAENFLTKVKKGDNVTVSFPSYEGLEMDTVIHRIGNVVKIQNRTFLVQLLLDNEEEKLKPNVLAYIKMKDYATDNAMLVPSIIIKNDLEGQYLYVAETDKGKTTAKKIHVTTGMSSAGKTMVTKGLKPGQKVIVKGYNLVKNGMEIKIEG